MGVFVHTFYCLLIIFQIKQTDIEHLPEAVTLFEAIIVAGPNSKLVMEFVEWMKKIVDEEVLHGSDITLVCLNYITRKRNINKTKKKKKIEKN